MTTMELQQYTKEVIDELSIYVESGEVHPYEASLLHLHLMKDKLQKQDSELLALADNVALHYKQLSPQR